MDVDSEFIALMDTYRQAPKGVGLIEASSKNLVVFSERMLGIRLYAWQVYLSQLLMESLSSPSSGKEFAALTSRQIGKSTLVAIFSLWCTVFNKYPGGAFNSTSVIITSASDVQAKKLLGEMRKLLRAGDRHMAETYKDPDGQSRFGKEFFNNLLSEKEPNNTTTISFLPYDERIHGLLLKGSKTGNTIKSYPPTSSVLGETASVVIIDEAGKTDKIDDEFFYDYIYPVGNSTNAIRLYTSTPWVSSGFFYNMVDPDNLKDDFVKPTVVTFTIDAIKLEAPNYYNNVLNKSIAQLKSDGKLDEIQRAYYCRFVKGESSFFNPDKIMDLFDDGMVMSDSCPDLCDLGLDFGGQTTSRTVITITKLDKDGMVRRLYKRVYPVGKDLGLIDDVADLMKRFNIQRMIPDDCAAGDFLIRSMKEKGWPVFPMNFKTDKIKKYNAFRSYVNRGLIKSFKDDDLKIEMLALEMEQGERSLKICHAPGYTDDEIDSFVMSCYFFVQDGSGLKTYEL